MDPQRLLPCLLALTWACAPRSAPVSTPAPAPGPPVTERQFQVREVEIENGAITVRLEIPPEPPGPKPALLGHLNESPAMLWEGAVMVTYRIDWARLKGGPSAPPPDAKNPVGKWVLAAPSPGVIGQHYLQQIAATATIVVPRVIDYLETAPEVDARRLAITGASTNGFIALQAIAADSRLTVATVLAACGDYHRFLHYSSMGMAGEPLALEPAYERWLRAQEVINHPRRMVHAALLMVNRAQDPLVPISCADETARVLQRAYAAAGRRDRFRFVRIEDLEGHGAGPRESKENFSWLRTWLLPAR